MVSKEPGAPGQPRVQDLRLEPEKPGSGWQAVVSWDPGETPVGRTFTLQYCRWVELLPCCKTFMFKAQTLRLLYN